MLKQFLSTTAITLLLALGACEEQEVTEIDADSDVETGALEPAEEPAAGDLDVDVDTTETEVSEDLDTAAEETGEAVDAVGDTAEEMTDEAADLEAEAEAEINTE